MSASNLVAPQTSAVFSFALDLTQATGTTTRVGRWRKCGDVRVEASLPQGLTAEEQLTVLNVLRRAPRFGHRYRLDDQAVWAEFCGDECGSARPSEDLMTGTPPPVPPAPPPPQPVVCSQCHQPGHHAAWHTLIR